MSKAGKRLIAAAKDALAIARGEKNRARVEEEVEHDLLREEECERAAERKLRRHYRDLLVVAPPFRRK
jgi:hypothetical protein